MNAYPAELVNHHYGCMFVAGLLPAQGKGKESETSTAAAAAAPLAAGNEDAGSQPASSSQRSTAVAKEDRATTSSQRRVQLPAEVFPTLTSDLCTIFASRGRSTAWDQAQGQSAAFHTVLVDRNVRLPPRKTRPTARTLTATSPEEQSGLAALPARSPLSPLHPSSPLFPDGLIAPIWLRKHRELVPAVYVAFFCLSEPEGERVSVDGGKDAEAPSTLASAEAMQDLKLRDEELIKMISDRKRTLNERGIKMTVVLLTTREMLEAAALECRLSYIRRSSQLDSRASLFVLTPVSKAEVGEFVTSLQSALYDASLDYYREHFRRVRRKRNRYPPNPSTVIQIMKATGEARGQQIKDLPLSREGWLARSSYKLATFAEMSANYEEAMANYAAAYQALSKELLPSTRLLPPRTRRWAEAKVLADTVSVRISRLHLYRGNSEEAWSQFRAHVKRFTELSQGWGIGETTMEFWSWLGKQYRLMGDLLDSAMRDSATAPLPAFRPSIHFPPLPTFLLHPSHLPTPTANGNVVPSYNPQHGNLAVPNEAAVASSCVPLQICPGAGECFYIAGLCALERWHRFKKMLWEETQSSPDGKRPDGEQENWSSANVAQEMKVDHAGQAIDALTKAYEALKRQERGRFSLFIASKIVNAYLDSGQHELALRFLDRIAKTYQAGSWTGPLLSQLLLAWVSAEKLNDRERQLRLLWAILSQSAFSGEKCCDAAVQALQAIVANDANMEASNTLDVHMDNDNNLLHVEIAFAKGEATLGDKALPFQLRLCAGASPALRGIDFDKLRVHFAAGQPDLIINGQVGKASRGSSISALITSSLEAGETDGTNAGQADLSWSDSSIRVLQGSIIPRTLTPIEISGISLHKKGALPFALHIDLSGKDTSQVGKQPRWLVSLDPVRYVNLQTRADPDVVIVRPRRHKLSVTLVHNQSAYIQETFSVRIELSNTDAVDLDCLLSARMSGGTVRLAQDNDPNAAGTSLSELQECSLGKVAAGSVLSKTIYFCFEQDRPRGIADVVIRARESEADASSSEVTQYSEYHTNVNVALQRLVTATYSAQWRQSNRSSVLGPDDDTSSTSSVMTAGDLQTSTVGHDSIASRSAFVNLNVALTFHCDEAITVKRVRIILSPNHPHLRLLRHALVADSAGNKLQETSVGGEWIDGDRWGGSYDLEVLSENAAGAPMEGEDGIIGSTGHLEVEWSRQGSKNHSSSAEQDSIASLALPLLIPPYLLSRLIVSLPTVVSGEQSFVMLITIVNPSKLPSDVLIGIDDSVADFSILSHRNFTVPNLLPRSTRSIPIHVSYRGAGTMATQAPGSPSKSGGAAPILRVLPHVRAWQRDRRDIPKATQQPDSREEGTSELETAHKMYAETERPPIANARPNVGIPLDVALRYSSSTRSANAGGFDSSTGARLEHSGGLGSGAGDLAARLSAENQRHGIWTILAQ